MIMKKPIIYSLIVMLVLAGCAPAAPNLPAQMPSFSGDVLPASSEYAYTRDMQIPDPAKVSNLEMIEKGFYQTIDHELIVDEELVNIAKEYCRPNDKLKIVTNFYDRFMGYHKYDEDFSYQHILTGITAKDIKLGMRIPLQIPYTGLGLGLQLSKNDYTKLKEHGFAIIEPNHHFLSMMKNNNPYEQGSIESDTEEWVSYLDVIAGDQDPERRYPYNSVYISSDLLLHTYHILFAKSLKAYEMFTARKLLEDIIAENLNHFAKLQEDASDELKEYYEYLTAYWLVAHILLPEEWPYNEELKELRRSVDDKGLLSETRDDFNETYYRQILTKRLEDALVQYPTRYSKEIKESFQHILDGQIERIIDPLAYAFAPNPNPDLVPLQNYTMFVPRGYYADHSLLKTYFMSMKWLMRQKFYMHTPKLTQASLILAKQFPASAKQKLDTLQHFVRVMVGSDDDLNIDDMTTFMKQENLNSDHDLVRKYDSERPARLSSLRPQKIISTSYVASEGDQSISEEEAKLMTAGFVLFGEKFTVDSWISDMLTAGPAEREYEFKPDFVSVYQILDTLSNKETRTELADLWLTTKHQQGGLSDKQFTSYPSVRDENKQQVPAMIDHQGTTLYSMRLEVMEEATRVPERAPAYMQVPQYIYKTLNTLLGTFTELKHDTILYVKQAFAELGMGGDRDECTYTITKPALPVPKGYVEPQISLIDKLSALSTLTSEFFGEINKTNYEEWQKELAFYKEIALAQQTNWIISDDDFEKLRFSDQRLESITRSSQYVPGEKGNRSALIADIFSSATQGAYYVANGRPLLMITLIDDTNGKRAVLGPVYSNYEFYGEPVPKTSGRYTDQDRREGYDDLENKIQWMSLPLQFLLR